MKVSELRLKTQSELVDELKRYQREKMNLRFQKAAREAVSVSRQQLVRKMVAKIKTVLNELKLRGENA
jgi:large subunit ribosomal protein L29